MHHDSDRRADLDSIRDNHEVYVDGQRVRDVTRHPRMRPLIDIRAQIYDMQHAQVTRQLLMHEDVGETNAIAYKLPRTRQDWWDRRRATDCILEAIGGVVTQVGDEAAGEMWPPFNGHGLGYSILATRPDNSVSYDGRTLVTRPLPGVVANWRLVPAHLTRRLLSASTKAFSDLCRSCFRH